MTISHLTATILTQWNPNLKIGGFRKAFRRFMFERSKDEIGTVVDMGDGTDEIITKRTILENIEADYGPDLGFIPDAYEFTDDEIRLYEIEDTNKLSAVKLEKLCNLWFTLDALDPDVTLRIFVCDRYGHNMHEIDLFNYWYAIQAQQRQLPSMAETKEILDIP